jgi:hypothetical protein
LKTWQIEKIGVSKKLGGHEKLCGLKKLGISKKTWRT